MYCWLQRRWLLAASLSLATGLLLQASSARAEEKGTFKRVKFQTVDSVEIQGTFYPAGGGKRKDTCVILLHAFHPQKGGTSHDGSWDSFAVQLQKGGYDVLSFDFRGFGSSTSVGPEFWDGMKFPLNQRVQGARKKPESISFKDFPPSYYPNLANDVAAARAYLNERGDVNTSNLVLVGAGEGATLGLLWMASECRLQRDTASDGPIRVAIMLDPDPEGRDLACGVWLNISPTLAGGNIRVPVDSLARDVARRGKVRMAFLSSKNDTASAPLARRYVEQINYGLAKDRRLATTYEVARAGQLTGSKLLGDNLDAGAWIVDECLPSVLDKRGSRDRRKHDMEKFAYFWVFPWPNDASGHPVVAKEPKEIMLRPVPVGSLLGR
jgi:pimeloyl-ACP methyl ester carboxylesterase